MVLGTFLLWLKAAESVWCQQINTWEMTQRTIHSRLSDTDSDKGEGCSKECHKKKKKKTATAAESITPTSVSTRFSLLLTHTCRRKDTKNVHPEKVTPSIDASVNTSPHKHWQLAYTHNHRYTLSTTAHSPLPGSAIKSPPPVPAGTH